MACGLAEEDGTAQLKRELTLALGTSQEFECAQNMTVFPPAKHDALYWDDLLTPEEREVRDRVRRFAVSAGCATVEVLASHTTKGRHKSPFAL